MNPITANSTPQLSKSTSPQMISQDQLMANLRGATILPKQAAPPNLVGTAPLGVKATVNNTMTPPVTQAYAPQVGPTTQRVADSNYASAITNAVSSPTPVPSSAITSGNSFAGAGATRNNNEALLQQYLDQQKQFQNQYISAMAPTAAEQALAGQLAGQRTQAALNQEQALLSGETSSFAGGEAQRVARTDAIKQAGIAAQLDVLQNQRENNVKQLEFLINSGDKSFKTQLEIQKLQADVSSIDKQTQDTYFNIAQSEGIDLPYDQTKSATQNLSALQKARAANKQQAMSEMTPREKASFSALVSKYREDPLVRAKDRSAGLQSTIDYLVANPDKLNNGPVQYNLLYAYTQALDSYNSAVREGELRNLTGIDSYIGQAQNFIQKVNNGQTLRAEQTQEIANAAQLLADSIKGVGDKRKSAYGREADIVGLGDQWARYTNEPGAGSTNFGGSNTDYAAKDEEALNEGWSQAEIDAFKQKYPGFSPVGSDTNPATEQNLMGGLGNMQGLMGQIQPLEYGVTDFGNMTGLLKAAPALQKLKVEIPQTSALSFANNNPGNLRFAGQDGAVKGKGGFARFNSPEDGLNALINQIKLDAGRGHTLATFINKFAPPTENNTKLYIQQAMKTLGVTKDTPISQIPLDKLAKFVALKESSTKVN